MSERLLTVEEFAERTRQHKETIRRQIRRGAIATIRTGRKHLIPESLATTPATETQRKSVEAPASATSERKALDIHPAPFPGAHLPDVAPLDLGALLKPPTPEEIARRLDALRIYDNNTQPGEAEAEELDLSGARAALYGYDRDADPTAGVRQDREDRAARIMEAGR